MSFNFNKYLLLLVLATPQLCLAAFDPTVIDVKTVGQDFGEAEYFVTAAKIPENETVNFPDELRDDNYKGVWVFDLTEDGVLNLTSKYAFDSISFNLYTSIDVTVTFKDTAVTETTSDTFNLPKNTANEWATHNLPVKRGVVSDKPVIVIIMNRLSHRH